MEITYDPAKDEVNQAKHGIALAEAADFEWDTAVIETDARKEYGEVRHIAFGALQDRMHVLVFVIRDGAVRVISLRKANSREVKRYGKQT
jgi:uncharacterized DUF497 family protein